MNLYYWRRTVIILLIDMIKWWKLEILVVYISLYPLFSTLSKTFKNTSRWSVKLSDCPISREVLEYHENHKTVIKFCNIQHPGISQERELLDPGDQGRFTIQLYQKSDNQNIFLTWEKGCYSPKQGTSSLDAEVDLFPQLPESNKLFRPLNWRIAWKYFNADWHRRSLLTQKLQVGSA